MAASHAEGDLMILRGDAKKRVIDHSRGAYREVNTSDRNLEIAVIPMRNESGLRTLAFAGLRTAHKLFDRFINNRQRRPV
jgi:hypothetical protein